MRLQIKKVYDKSPKKHIKLNNKVEKKHTEKTNLIENELKPREIPMRFLN